MRIAIHKRDGGFTERWIEYCKKNNIDYILVNCYESNIIEQVKNCSALLWHYNHGIRGEGLFAKQLLFAVQQSGKVVFPNYNTNWHFDDKIGQKYLFESLEIPSIKTYVFYKKEDSLNWIESAKFPKVFKLSSGAGAINVRLVKSKQDAKKIVSKAFGKGFKNVNRLNIIIDDFKKLINKQKNLKTFIKSFIKDFLFNIFKNDGRESGYAYFQEFIPNNKFDTRVIVIGNKAFAIRRFVRDNDFRASGSGKIDFDCSKIDLNLIKMAFEISNKMEAQCIALDFVYNDMDEPLVIESSYGFSVKPYDNCEGYWTNDLKFVKGKFNACGWMIENVLKEINE